MLGARSIAGSPQSDRRGATVNHYTEDVLHLVTRERHQQRAREAEAERLAREIRGTTPKRRRLRLPGLVPGTGRRATQPRLEA
jgi:hypothetical protein